MSCIKTEQERLSGEGASKAMSINSLQSQASQLESNIKKIKSKMDSITTADSTKLPGDAKPAGAAPPAPAPAAPPAF